MSTQAADTAVGTSIVVAAPIERAFSVFTDGIGSWWSPGYHIIDAELAEMVFEPRVGGHLYDRGVDGARAAGPVSWPTSRPTGSSSAATSTPGGSLKPTPPRRSPRGRRRATVTESGGQPEPLRLLHRLRAVAYRQLAIERRRVLLDRVRRQEQLLGDLAVRRARGDQVEHLALAL